MVITITNLTTLRLKAILTDDRQASLINWINSIPEEIKAKINEVYIDMKPLFETVIKNLLSNAAIVVDKFHLIKDANSRIDEARLMEQEVLGKRKLIPKLVFLKGKERLSEKEKALLQTLLVKHKSLYEFYWVKEKLRDMYQAKTKEEAANQLSLLIKNMECSDDAAIYQWAQTLRRWRYAILNYFDSKTTNAFTEGTHTKIKLIKCLSYGFRNVEVYVKKMLLAFIPFALLLPNFPHVC